MRIAILEDDPVQQTHLVHILETQLALHDDVVSCAVFSQGEALRRALRYETFDALVLDWNVPDLDGIDLLQWLRSFQGDEVPVLMLSSRSSERDVSVALGVGADDYIIKPFRPLELCARLQRLLRRRAGVQVSESLVFGAWRFDRATLSVVFTNPAPQKPNVHQLTDREFRLALALFRYMGQLVSRAHLLESSGYSSEELLSRTLDSHIYRLRNKLNLTMTRGLRLQTVYGKGYRLEAMVPEQAEGTAAEAQPTNGV
ncbi:response regulator transcription factor [Ottowia thiooxydans]|uniref:response regulator transcription factor n=1 Tax=Ottowia thiooxydans TaxID=219182 RepID=UPI00040FB222|nr:response regulator transcription factor [Ottowia thiooxydans]